jgi:hypothetical protein
VNRGLVGVGLVLGVAFGLATACSGSSSVGSAGSEAAAPYEAEDAGAAGEQKSTGQGDSQGETSGVADDQNISQPGVDRTLVRTANIELAAGNVGETVDRARDIAANAGGYAGQEEVREQSATLALRVPSDRFDQALDELSELGRVISRDQSAEDVTEKVVDLDSRIATQRASVSRVRTLLARASTVDEIVRIEEELTTRESDLEVAMSTVTIRIGKISAPARPRQDESGGFLAGLSDGWGAFLDAGAVTLRVLGAVLPFLLVLAVPAVPVIRWWRRRRTTATAAQQP